MEQRDFEPIAQIKQLQMEAELKLRDSIKAMHAFHYEKLRRFLGAIVYDTVCEKTAKFLQEHPFGNTEHNVGFNPPASDTSQELDSTTSSDLPPSYDSIELPLLPETHAAHPPAYPWNSENPIADEDYPEDSNRAALAVLQEQESQLDEDLDHPDSDNLRQLRTLSDLLETELDQLRSRPYQSTKVIERSKTLFEDYRFIRSITKTEIKIVEQKHDLTMLLNALAETSNSEEDLCLTDPSRRGETARSAPSISGVGTDGYHSIIYNENHCALGRRYKIDLFDRGYVHKYVHKALMSCLRLYHIRPASQDARCDSPGCRACHE